MSLEAQLFRVQEVSQVSDTGECLNVLSHWFEII